MRYAHSPASHNTQFCNSLCAALLADAIFRLTEHSALLVVENVNKIAFSASKFSPVLFHRCSKHRFVARRSPHAKVRQTTMEKLQYAAPHQSGTGMISWRTKGRTCLDRTPIFNGGDPKVRNFFIELERPVKLSKFDLKLFI
ncbi:hypothetical protein L596_009453 [Steinernema carpocapsae]|uniref:Uncharacterized protein n=1 Tax=Steinernema carpocapsae TaxID=34508 RepID=A0A4U5PFE4_STECR|nr:hypothetical protein L596_009453 [Steinernema carpocapsae]